MSNEIAELTENMISELALKETSKDAECLPLSRISSLGSILKNAFSYIGVNFEISVPNKNSLYTVQNLSAGDVLKKSKGDFSWGAIKAADGKSKMAKLKEVDALCVKKVATVNPALIIMAATLHSLEKKIDKLQEYGERIISFLENEKQSEIIADVQTLLGIITNYKYNWDNDMYLTNNHKMVLDIQRTSRGNINFYQKTISDLLSKKESSKTQKQTEESLNGFINAFKYLRMSLYTFQRLLRLCPYACACCLHMGIALAAFGVVGSLSCFRLNSRTEPEFVVMPECKFQHLAVLWLCTKGDLSRRELPVFSTFKNSHPERLVEKYRQHTIRLVHIFPS